MRPYYEEEQLRFSKKANNANERTNFEGWFTEQISLYGQEVEYYTSNYTLTGHDPVYGEQPSATYSDAVKVIMMLELTENSGDYAFYIYCSDPHLVKTSIYANSSDGVKLSCNEDELDHQLSSYYNHLIVFFFLNIH